MTEPKTLLLTETGVESLPDGRTAVNVGPIVRALAFLTEGRGEDRGTDENGNPLPDLMSLAFDVVEAIILGGRKAEFFRQVKRDLEAQNEGAARSSLALAKQARRVHAAAPATSLDHAADVLQALLGELPALTLDEPALQELKQALESFRAFGADRWVSATAQLIVAVNKLGAARGLSPAPLPSKPKRRQRAPVEGAAQPASGRKASPKKARKNARPKPPVAPSPKKARAKKASPKKAAAKPEPRKKAKRRKA